MERDEVLGKIKDMINHLIQDDPSDPKSVEAGHAEKASANLHDIITAKTRDRVVGVQEPVDPDADPSATGETDPDADPDKAEATTDTE